MPTAVTNVFTADQIAEMRDRVYEVNVANHWFEDERDFEDGIALLHSEVSEMLEAYRDWGLDDATGHEDHPWRPWNPDATDKHHPEPLLGACGTCSGPMPKPEGVGSEAADVLIRLLDEIHRQGIPPENLAPEAVVQWADEDAEVTVGQVCARLHHMLSKWLDLSWTTRETIDAQAVHERDEAMAFGASLVLAGLTHYSDALGIDLAAEVDRKLAFNATRGPKHGGKRL